jgi:aryl-alcohol dehydrogenase-like predicted oxidoreductase
MQYRKLGRTNFEVSEIGYGAWGIGGRQWLGANDHESAAALRRAISLGVNLIDTALAYGDGHSEQLVGRVVRQTDHKIYVATKVPPKNGRWPATGAIQDVFPYAHIMASAEESLRNLGLETIDLLQLHVWSADWVEADDWRRAFEDLKRSGKTRAVGISITEHDPDSGLSAIRTGLIDAVQVIYNIFDQTPERQLFPLALEENIGVLARVPLDEGALAGRITESTTFPPGDFRDFYFRENRKKEVVEHVDALRRDLDRSGLDGSVDLAEMALRFCLSHRAVSSVIPGMRTMEHAQANAALSDRGPLTAEMIAVLRRHAWERNYYS